MTVLDTNIKLWNERSVDYFYHTESDRGSPQKYHDEHPGRGDFIRVPLQHETKWAFRTFEDLQHFVHWSINQPIILPDWRK